MVPEWAQRLSALDGLAIAWGVLAVLFLLVTALCGVYGSQRQARKLWRMTLFVTALTVAVLLFEHLRFAWL